jgi:6-hydroxytryprostatin B O-methyltransferase
MCTSMDLQIGVGLDAKETRKEDWVELFKQADRRLSVQAFDLYLGSAVTLIEDVFEG